MDPSALRAKPIATPTANSNARLSNSAPPAALMASKNGPITGALILPSRSGWPSRSRMPAAGSTAMGSIRLLPRRCSCAKPGMFSLDFCCAAAPLVTSLMIAKAFLYVGPW